VGVHTELDPLRCSFQMQVMRVLLSIGVKAVLDGPLEREAARERERQRVLRKLAARVRQRALVTLRQVRGNWGRTPGVARIRVWLRTTKVRGSRRDAGRELRRLLRCRHRRTRRSQPDHDAKLANDMALRDPPGSRAPDSRALCRNRQQLSHAALGNLQLTKLAPVHIQAVYNDWPQADGWTVNRAASHPRPAPHTPHPRRRARPRCRATADRPQSPRCVPKAASESRAPEMATLTPEQSASRRSNAFAHLLAGADCALDRRTAR